MSLNPINNSNGSAPGGAAAAPQQQQLGQADFLELMVAQFQNQDPFKPMENGEFLGQIAQFSTVQGLDDLNSRFESFAAAIGDNQALGAAQLIGRDALFQSNSFQLTDNAETVSGALQTDAPGTVTVDIMDGAGQLVRRMGVEVNGSGQSAFEWDGLNNEGEQAPAGDYQIQAYTAINGAETAIPVLIAARINGVSMGGAQGASLNVEGLGQRSLTEVHELF